MLVSGSVNVHDMDCMNASSLKIIIIDLLHIGDDLLVVLMAAEFEETLLGLGWSKTQGCFGYHYLDTATKYTYIYT